MFQTPGSRAKLPWKRRRQVDDGGISIIAIEAAMTGRGDMDVVLTRIREHALSVPMEGRGDMAAEVEVVSGVATSYSNSGGQGNRTALINVVVRRTGTNSGAFSGGRPDNLVDGATGTNTTDSAFFSSGATDYEIYFDFRPTGFKQVVDEFTWFQDNATTHGSWVVEAWDGNGGWVELKSAFTLGGTAQQVSWTNSTAYLVYRLRQVSGAASSSPWLKEVEFKLAQGAAISSSTSYANAGGTGDRQASIVETTTATLSSGTFNLVIDGTTGSAQFAFQSSQTGKNMKFDFGSAKVIDEWRWYAGQTNNHGAWLTYGSTDDVTYEQLGVPLGFATTASFVAKVFDQIKGNVKGYQYYKIEQITGCQHADGTIFGHQTSGLIDNAEIEFKIAA